jgi:hypothetical protein
MLHLHARAPRRQKPEKKGGRRLSRLTSSLEGKSAYGGGRRCDSPRAGPGAGSQDLDARVDALNPR